MYASDWLFALFSNIIPISQYNLFLDCFFAEGWNFFYKFSLAYMEVMRPELLKSDDMQDIIEIIKFKKYKKEEPASDYTGTSSDLTENDSSD